MKIVVIFTQTEVTLSQHSIAVFHSLDEIFLQQVKSLALRYASDRDHFPISSAIILRRFPIKKKFFIKI